MRIGIGNPLDNSLSEPELTLPPVAPNEKNDTFFGLCYRLDYEVFNDWASVTRLKRVTIVFAVQEPDITDDFKQFLINMYGLNWQKKLVAYLTKFT